MTKNGSGVDCVRWLALTAFLVGCPSSSGTPPVDAGQDTAVDQAPVEDVPVDTAPPPPDGPVASGIGEPCTAEGNPFPPQRGTCAPGQLCLVGQVGFRNGYCSRACASRDNHERRARERARVHRSSRSGLLPACVGAGRLEL